MKNPAIHGRRTFGAWYAVAVAGAIGVMWAAGCAGGGDEVQPGGSDAKPAPTPGAGVGLEDTVWRLKQVQGSPVIAGENGASLQLMSGSRRAAGRGSVNRYSAGYTLEGQSLAFTPAIMTKMAGPPELMTQEDRFMNALTATRSFRISGETLELLGAGGEVLATFEPEAR